MLPMKHIEIVRIYCLLRFVAIYSFFEIVVGFLVFSIFIKISTSLNFILDSR